MQALLSSDSDMRAIEELNRQDINAVITGDVATITSQWTDDFVVLPPAGPIIRGYTANAEMAESVRGQIEALEPLEYRVDFEEIKVLGEYAYEWGTYRGSTRLRTSGQVVSYSGKLMRILQRQADGSWKMHRTMTSVDPPAA